MHLWQIIALWLREEFPNWRVRRESYGDYISYRKLDRPMVRVFADRVEIDEDKRTETPLIISAAETRFFELLWNRLYTMELGFQKALDSRESNRTEGK